MDILLCYSTRLVLAMVACERGEGVGHVDIGSEISFSCACFLLVCTYYERVLGSQSNSRHRLLYVNTILMACTLRVLINVCAHLEVFTRAPAQSPAAPLRHVVHTSSELRSVIPVFSGIRLFLCVPMIKGTKSHHTGFRNGKPCCIYFYIIT